MNILSSGTVTSPKGFTAGAVEANIKYHDKLDLAVLYSEKPCIAAGMFTTNAVKAAPVVLSKEHLADGKIQAVVVNSGCANACTGSPGFDDAVGHHQIVRFVTAAHNALDPPRSCANQNSEDQNTKRSAATPLQQSQRTNSPDPFASIRTTSPATPVRCCSAGPQHPHGNYNDCKQHWPQRSSE